MDKVDCAIGVVESSKDWYINIDSSPFVAGSEDLDLTEVKIECSKICLKNNDTELIFDFDDKEKAVSKTKKLIINGIVFNREE